VVTADISLALAAPSLFHGLLFSCLHAYFYPSTLPATFLNPLLAPWPHHRFSSKPAATSYAFGQGVIPKENEEEEEEYKRFPSYTLCLEILDFGFFS
jgi:hypothetical protein